MPDPARRLRTLRTATRRFGRDAADKLEEILARLIGARAQWIAPEGRCLRQSATPERDGSDLRRDFPEPFRKPYVRAQRIAKGPLAVRPILTGHACNQRTRRQQSRRCRPLCVRLSEMSRN